MKVAIVVPVYNHGEPLRATAARLAEFGLPVIVVDDGSDEATKRAIAEVAARYRAAVFTLAENGGKGHAVMAGLRAAAQQGFTHAVQVDADGQHDLDDLPKLLAAAKGNPAALICGEPQFDESVPKARLYGRKLTAFCVAVETLSLRMPDTMCGYRVYPLAATVALLDSARLGRRMDFDIEIVVRLNWRNVPVVGVPTAVIYPEGGTSNFRVFADNALITKLHTKLVLGMLVRLPMLVTRRVGAALHWATLSERGGVAGMRFLFAVYRLFGRAAFTLLLYPVAAYFCVAAGSRAPRVARLSRCSARAARRARAARSARSRRVPSRARVRQCRARQGRDVGRCVAEARDRRRGRRDARGLSRERSRRAVHRLALGQPRSAARVRRQGSRHEGERARVHAALAEIQPRLGRREPGDARAHDPGRFAGAGSRDRRCATSSRPVSTWRSSRIAFPFGTRSGRCGRRFSAARRRFRKGRSCSPACSSAPSTSCSA